MILDVCWPSLFSPPSQSTLPPARLVSVIYEARASVSMAWNQMKPRTELRRRLRSNGGVIKRVVWEHTPLLATLPRSWSSQYISPSRCRFQADPVDEGRGNLAVVLRFGRPSGIAPAMSVRVVLLHRNTHLAARRPDTSRSLSLGGVVWCGWMMGFGRFPDSPELGMDWRWTLLLADAARLVERSLNEWKLTESERGVVLTLYERSPTPHFGVDTEGESRIN